jgi:zinc protease
VLHAQKLGENFNNDPGSCFLRGIPLIIHKFALYNLRMLEFEKFTLPNGLKLIVNEDKATPLIAVNILYQVGSRNESPDRTGFAHLFEHLMFGGSANIPSYDEPLQHVGGENNAFTSNDITNYYLTVPADNIETALWLESDRMLELNFSHQSLEVQRNVVIEEFRQRYLNQPYGDIWLLMRPLAYKVHPYHWPTIGKSIDHIREATLDDVKNFFYLHYAPNNAIMTISGNITPAKAYELVNKWFGDIPYRKLSSNQIPAEPEQTAPRKLEVKRKVPYHGIYKVYHMAGRNSREFQVADMITDLLSSGKSARLYQRMIKELQLFSDINAYVTGDVDPGLVVVGGKLIDGVSPEQADNEIYRILSEIQDNLVSDAEVQKVKNKFESNLLIGQTNILNKGMALSYYEMLGDANLLNTEAERYNSITTEEVRSTASRIFSENNSSTLYYIAENE